MTAATGFSNLRPPPFPQDSLYAACYCEENAYLLVEALNQLVPLSKKSRQDEDTASSSNNEVWTSYVVFVTNPTKTTLLWDQKASGKPDQGSPVIWDYHVFVLVTCTISKPRSDPSSNPPSSSNDFASASNPDSLNFPIPDSPAESPDPSYSRPPRKRSLSFFRKRSKSRPASPTSPSTESVQSFPPQSATSKALFSTQNSLEPNDSDAFKGKPYAWVYDFDSILSSSKSQQSRPHTPTSNGTKKSYPVPFDSYMSSTFKHLFRDEESTTIHPDLLPVFRLIPSRDYLYNFSSDRSHMLLDGIRIDDPLASHPSSYIATPPSWHMICGRNAYERGEAVGGNLRKWLKVDDLEEEKGFGKVWDWKDFCSGKALERMINGTSEENPNINNPLLSTSSAKIDGTNSRAIGRRPPPPPPEERYLPNGTNPSPERPKGGRITSPDFPAYLASALSNRAGRARGSYLGLNEG